MSIPPTFSGWEGLASSKFYWILQGFIFRSFSSSWGQHEEKRIQFGEDSETAHALLTGVGSCPLHPCSSFHETFMKLARSLPRFLELLSMGSSHFKARSMPWDAMRGRVSHSCQAHAHGALRLLTRKARQAGQYYTVLTYLPISGMIFTNRIHNCSGFVQEEAERPST